ncbi:MAG: hypothetical protein R3237_01705 [Nitrosopumilaceae archaeon]|nr:hypothetical protein [Nitrosopumilaceae archaeon]
MTFLKHSRIAKDLDFIRNISQKVDQKLAQKNSSKVNLDKLTVEELQDIQKLAGIANFLLTKYEDKKETKEILEYFVSIIKESSESLDEIDDEVSVLILSAEDSLNKIKDMHANISEKYDLEKPPSKEETFENSANNLTKIAIDINSLEYQENSTDKDAQVI